MEEESLYIGAKLIKAVPMTDSEFRKQKGMSPEKIDLNAPGYRVTYEDGYVSWSPKDVFERAYRKVTTSEKAMFT